MTRDEAREIAIEATDRERAIASRLEEAAKIEEWLMREPEAVKGEGAESKPKTLGEIFARARANMEKERKDVAEKVFRDAFSSTGFSRMTDDGEIVRVDPKDVFKGCNCDMCKADGTEDQILDEAGTVSEAAWDFFKQAPQQSEAETAYWVYVRGANVVTEARDTFMAGWEAAREPRPIRTEAMLAAREAIGGLLATLGTRLPCTTQMADDLTRSILRAINA